MTTYVCYTISISGETEVDDGLSEDQIHQYLLEEADDLMKKAGADTVHVCIDDVLEDGDE